MSDNATAHPVAAYDSQVRRTIPYYDAFQQETLNLVQALNLSPAYWLDTGCGTGTLVQQAYPHFPRTIFLLADPAEAMLQAAARKLDGMPRTRLLAPSTTQDLVLADVDAVDVVTAIQCHHYLTPEERARATAVCYALLAPGGAYITFENIRPSSEFTVAAGKQNWANFQIAQGKSADAAAAHLQRFGTEFFPITIDAHLHLLHASGFRVVELLWYSCMQAGFYAIK